MNKENIRPEKITKPIQLLGAWLVGLFSISSSFLLAATKMPLGSWEASVLVIAAILNVPIFLGAVFLLQTKFRPELQEDSYYSTYLSQKTNKPITITKKETSLNDLEKTLQHIDTRLEKLTLVNSNESAKLNNLLIGINGNLDDYKAIKEELGKLDFNGVSMFGGNGGIPEKRVVAISEYLSKEEVNQAIHLAKSLNFKYYAFFNNQMENTKEDILLGAYGDATYEIL